MHIIPKTAAVVFTATAVAAVIIAGPASADGGLGLGGSAGGRAEPATTLHQPAAREARIEPIGRVYPKRLRVASTQGRGRSLYRIERAQGYSPRQAAALATRIKRRIYPAARWSINTPQYGAVFFYR